jgi:acetaldehyde dehydrogenase/alcohol dehydrogenase
MTINNAESLDLKIKQVRNAQKKYSTYSQAQVDEIFRQAAMAANNARIQLAKMAVEETGMGIVEDK